jgi:hypothetical protein
MRRRLSIVAAAVATGAAGVLVGGALAVPSACVPGTQCGASSISNGGSVGGTTTAASPTTAQTPVQVVLQAPTLRLSTPVIDFGKRLTLSGAVKTPAGQLVQLLAQTCGFSAPRIVAETKTGKNGTFSFRVEPTRNVVYRARYATLVSTTQLVRVRPLVELRRSSGSSFSINVSVGGGMFFSSKAELQRYDAARKTWRRLAVGTLRASSSPTALVAVSSATVTTQVPAGSKVRATVGRAAIGKCYEPASSFATSS